MPPSEPLVSRATVIALVAAVLALLTAFGFDLTNDQKESILVAIAAAAPLAAAAWARAHVTPWPAVDPLKR